MTTGRSRRQGVIVHLDFETRSRADLKTAGAWRYSTDPSTQVLCASWAIDDGPISTWKRGDPVPQGMFDALESGAILEAHNVFFEYSIWTNATDWPALDPKRLSCTAAKAALATLPRDLERATLAIGIKGGKDKEGQRVMRILCKPRKPTKNDFSEWVNDPEMFDALYKYCERDVELERELSNRLGQMPAFELRAFRADIAINLRGIAIDRAAVMAALKILERTVEQNIADLTRLTDGAVTTVNQLKRMKEWLATRGVIVDGMDDETLLGVMKKGVKDDAARKVIEIRRFFGRASISKFKAFIACAGDDDVLRGLLLFFGAQRTGRWAGRLVQPQNFPRGDAKGDMGEMIAAIKKSAKIKSLDPLRKFHYDPIEVLATALRGIFVAREGLVFASGDYSAIEARALFWLAGQEDALEVYRNKGDIYREMGSVIFKKPPADLNVHFERMMGKTVVLGCGYGMGIPKFIATCKKAYDVDVDLTLATRCVMSYRRKYKKVVSFWKSIEAAARTTIVTGEETTCGKLKFSMRGRHLRMHLPSGRKIPYRCATINDDGEIEFTNSNLERETTYGGKLTENACSAVSRDLLTDAIVRIEEDAPFKLVLSVHDELVVEGKPGCGKKLEALMRITPDWAQGFPIEAESWEDTRYHK